MSCVHQNTTGGGASLVLGSVDGFVVKYSSTTSVGITSGNIEANGSEYTLAADTTHAMTSLASGFDFHYIYIDDDASTAPTAVIIDSTTEPAYSHSLRGWYNGDDRCIGAINSPAASVTVEYFDTTVISDKLIQNSMNRYEIVTNLTPTGAWQTPNTAESDVYTPVNSKQALIHIAVNDATGLWMAWRNNTAAAAIASVASSPQFQSGYQNGGTSSWGPLDSLRKVKIAAESNDTAIYAFVMGYGYQR